jgi:hypothetical protein
MMSSEQLERQAEQNRADVELTIDELRARLTPGQIVDEILSYARDGGRQFTANLGRQVTNNPLPVALIGAGLAWFMFGQDAGGSASRASYRSQSTGPDVRGMTQTGDAAREAAGGVRQAAGDAADSVRHAAESAGHAVSETARSLGEGASSTYQAASSTVSEMAVRLGSKASEMEDKALRATQDIVGQVKAQPLMLVGIGLVLGAAIGAAFPATDLENRVMGDTADEVKREAKQVASRQMDKAKEAAHEFVEDAVKAPGNGADSEQTAPAGQYG